MLSSRDLQRCASGQSDRPLQGIEQLTLRRSTVFGIGLIAVLAVLGVATVVAVRQFNLAPDVARYASRALGRSVTIGALRVHVGFPVTVELRGLAVSNAPGGSQAQMLQIARLDAEIAPWSLAAWAVLRRPPVVRHLAIEGARLLLEHAGGDRPNWRFGTSKPAARHNPRAGFPSLLDARLHDGEIDLRASGGSTIRIRLDEARIAAEGLDQPVTLAATGAYNATPVQLSAALHSFDELHDPAQPFGTDIHLTSADTQLEFVGTMTDPINADGAVGRLVLTAPNLDRLLAIAGADDRAALPLVVDGAMTHQGDVWTLSGARGSLVGHPFQLDFNMREGRRHAPDNMTVDANFSILDLTALEKGEKSGAMSLHIDDQPGNLIDAHVGAKQFTFGAVRADDVDLKLNVSPGALAVQHLALHLVGGTGQVTAAVKNTQSGSDTQFDAALTGADTGQLSGLLGIGSMPLTGAVDAHANLRLGGNTLDKAMRASSGTFVLSMQGGSIQHKLVEQASTDLHLLFGKSEGSVRIACLLGVLDLHDGIGHLAPFRIRTADGTVAAAGTIDTRRDAIDLTVASEAASTGLFALDVPLHVAGPIANPHVSPAPGTGRTATNANADLGAMPAALQDLVRRSPCLMGSR
jgi:uncharacterized protein involved in outer membrane biogenesis